MDLKGRITIFTKSGCLDSKAAKAKLDALSLPYHEINLLHHPNQFDQMFERSRVRRVPQIYFNEIYIGGSEHLEGLTNGNLQFFLDIISNVPAPPSAPKLPDCAKLNDCAVQQNSQIIKFTKRELRRLIMCACAHTGFVADHERLRFAYPMTFTGADFVAYVNRVFFMSGERALEIGERLVRLRFIKSMYPRPDMPFTGDDDALFHRVEGGSSNALNVGFRARNGVIPVVNFVDHLQGVMTAMLTSHFRLTNNALDCALLRRSGEFAAYLSLALQIAERDVTDMSRNESLAFFVNLHNAMHLHGYMLAGFPDSKWKRYKLLSCTAYMVNGHTFSLLDIKDGILRTNRKSLDTYTAPFSATDRRHEFVISPLEPLVHFGLTAGTSTCPAIRVFSAKNVISELTTSASAFLLSQKGCTVNMESEMVYLSSIFKSYRSDFGRQNKEILEFIIRLLPECSKKEDLKTLSKSDSYRILYIPQGWEIDYRFISGNDWHSTEL